VTSASPREFGSSIDSETNVRIRVPGSQFRRLDPSPVVNGDCEDPDRRIERCTGQELFQVESERVGIVHHRTEDRVNGRSDERGQTGNHREVESDGFEDEIEIGRLHERQVYRLDC
jgi:hypothetical protein